MPAQIQTNINPYYDDFDEEKNFHRILFKAGYPVQARELTQSQTLLQDQLEKFASQFLADGDQVVPGEFSLVNPAPYVRLAQITQGSTAEEFVGSTLTGATSGVTAKCIFAVSKTEDEDAVVYVTYESSGEDAEYSTFLEGETLESTTANRYTAVVGINEVSRPIDSPPIGFGSLFKVAEGAYFVNGFVVRNEEQTIVLDKYGITPNYEVGFEVTEEFVTSSADPSLLDNAQGSSNFAGPGADRLRIVLKLTKRVEEESDFDFVQLVTVLNGSVVGKPNQTVKWDWLYDILAKRTNDESGDYIVEDFPIVPMEYYNVEGINGVYDPDENDLYPAPLASENKDRINFEEADENYVLKVNPGSAYVQGYEVGYNNHVYVQGKKPRETNFDANNFSKIGQGHNFNVTHSHSCPDLQNIQEAIDTHAIAPIISYRNYNDGYLGETTFNAGNRPLLTYHIICDGDIGTIDTTNHVVVYQGTNSAVVTSPNSDLKPGDSVDSGTSTIMFSLKVDPAPSGVVYPKYYSPKSLIPDEADGTFDQDSVYQLGVGKSQYFTEFVVVPDDATASESWVIGDNLYGEESGAIAVVEEGSNNNFLIVSNIIGVLSPGETVYQTQKSARIIRDGEVNGFAFLQGSTDLTSVDNLHITCLGKQTTLNITTHFTISDNKIILNSDGRDKLRRFPFIQNDEDDAVLEYIAVAKTGNSTVATGYAIVPTLRITNTITKTKSFYSALNPGSTDEFTADVSTRNSDEGNLVTLADGATFRGVKDSNTLTCESISSDASLQLVSGDIIVFTDDDGNEIRKMVHFVTRPFSFSGNRQNCKIYLTTTLSFNVSGKVLERIRIKDTGEVDGSLIYQLPQYLVSSIENDPINTRISYTVYREFLVNVQPNATFFKIITNKANETVVDDYENITVSIARMPGLIEDVGKFIQIDPTITLEDSNRKATFSTPYPFTSGGTLKVIAPVFVDNAQAKRKELVRDVEIRIPQAEAAAFDVISLGLPDVLRINKIILDEGAGIDVFTNYMFDNGQRANSYELSRLIRKTGGVPTADLLVKLDYFKHINEGDFFSIDSYTSGLGDINYREVPIFTQDNSSQTERSVTYLRDCVDFRPIVNSVGPDTSYIATITPGVSSVDSTNFNDSSNGGSAHVPRVPVPGTFFKCDIQYYLPRIDSLFIDKSGELILARGKSSKSPVKPQDISSAMRLYDIELPAYTFSINESNVRKYYYKRYQMKDIASIEKKVERLEDLVALSLLEQTAVNFNVKDAQTGLDRFKNGIVVDPFKDHSRGDVGNEYRSSVDEEYTILRAGHFTEQIDLEEEFTDLETQTSRSYVNNDGIITLKFDNQSFLRNPFATRFINLQPFTVFTYDGELELTPSVDNWKDTRRLPDLVVKDDSMFDALTAMSASQEAAGFGLNWGSWRTTGVKRDLTEEIIRRNDPRYDSLIASLKASGNLTLAPIGARNSWLRSMSFAESFRAPLRAKHLTTSTYQKRTATQTVNKVSTSRIQNTSYGDRVVDMRFAETMRTRPVQLAAYRLKPNTRYYVFFDEIDVSRWVSPDTIRRYSDGKRRYYGRTGSTNTGFGLPIVSDDSGTVSAMFVIPNGRAPSLGSKFTDLRRVSYDTSGPTRSFSTGTKTVRITSHPQNSKDNTQLEGYADANYVASGIISDKQQTVIATRVPKVTRTTIQSARTETRVNVDDGGIISAEYYDPIAQSFMVDNIAHKNGVFVTELEAFFKTKDSTQGVMAYLVTTEGGVPTTKLLPNAEVSLQTDSIIRVTASLSGSAIGRNYSEILAGARITGSTSGATGFVKSTVTFRSASSNPAENVENTVYDIVLDNYSGEFVPGESIVNRDTRKFAGDTSTFQIIENEVDLTRLDITALGIDYGANEDINTGEIVYESSLIDIQFSQPELPGGTSATGTAKVSKEGRIYDAELLTHGSGYTSVPTVTVVDNGNSLTTNGVGAEFRVRIEPGEPAVVMGVATSEDGTVGTKFKFKSPIYLMPGETYAFVLKSPTSVEYTAWISKMGENRVGTNNRVTQQPSLGSLFKSQNGSLWTEDQTSDIKFEMKRANFMTNYESKVYLQNTPIGIELLTDKDPIETNSALGSGDKFGDNPKIVRVYYGNHGLLPGDYFELEGVDGNPGNIPSAELNDLHRVLNAHFDYFDFETATEATVSQRAGGLLCAVSVGRPFEVANINTGAVVLPGTQFEAEVVTAGAKAITGFNSENAYVRGNPTPIELLYDAYFDTPMQVANYINEGIYNSNGLLNDNRSFQLNFTLSTQDPKISPVLDIQRTAAAVTRSLIDKPDPDDAIFGPVTRTITFSDDISGVDVEPSFNIGDNNMVVDKVLPSINKVMVRGSLPELSDQISGALNGKAISGITSSQGGEYYKDETKQEGSTYAKWASRLFIFENECDGIELKLTSVFYDVTDIKCYYKLKAVGFDGDITDLNWIPFNPEQSLVDNKNTVNAVPVPGLADGAARIAAREYTNYNPTDIDSTEWVSLIYSAQNLAKFDGISIKIVMTAENPCQAPLIDDFILICSE